MNKQHMVVPKDFLDHLAKTRPSAWKLIVNPDHYIRDAIEELERQLKTCQSPKKKLRLQLKISDWKGELESITAKLNNEAASE